MSTGDVANYSSHILNQTKPYVKIGSDSYVWIDILPLEGNFYGIEFQCLQARRDSIHISTTYFNIVFKGVQWETEDRKPFYLSNKRRINLSYEPTKFRMEDGREVSLICKESG